MCTQTCPTGALAGGYADNGELMISFDPVDGPLAINASGCAPRWHAGRSRWTIASTSRREAAGRVELNRSATHTCERSRQPVAPTASMGWISDILGDRP